MEIGGIWKKLPKWKERIIYVTCIGVYGYVVCSLQYKKCPPSVYPEHPSEGNFRRRGQSVKKGGFFRISLYRTRNPKTACRLSPCINHRSCVDNGSPTLYTCTCKDGFTSKNCSINIDECHSGPCVSNNTVSCTDGTADYTCNCKPGYTGKNCQTEIDECQSSPCKNDGTCTDEVNGYTCACKPGYTGSSCGIDIDECASNPCQNGATCEDHENFFKCKCAPGFYGTLCDTSICRPLPADVVFVLDSSVSMTKSQFNKQLEFVSNFTNEIRIGPRDFQISVITYSFEAHIEFYLDQYRDNVTLKEAIANITFKPGVTNTHLGLEKVNDVFGAGHGGDVTRYNNTRADRLVYLMTDGMANNPKQAAKEAEKLKSKHGISISVIGIGNQVSHEELYDISSKFGQTASVYSVQNFNSLYTVLKRLVHYSCDECTRSKKSDVAMVLDTSFYMTDVQFSISQEALTYIVEGMDIGENETQLSLTTFDASHRVKFGFQSFNSAKNIIPEIYGQSKSRERSASGVDIADVIHYVRTNVLPTGRNDSRSFILVVTNGDFCQSVDAKLKDEKAELEKDGTEIIVVGTGNQAHYQGLLSIASDPFDVYIATEDDSHHQNLDVMKSYFEYSVCHLS